MSSHFTGDSIASLSYYKYTPISHDARTFRLFKINPVEHDEDLISGSLVSFESSQHNEIGNRDETRPASPWPVSYRALSYEWGPATKLLPIVIDGEVLWIRQNLHSFLVSYRRTISATDYPSGLVTWPLRTKVQYIWIDQISIDQSNILERNHQVGMMYLIYRHATEIVAWLGDQEPDVELALAHRVRVLYNQMPLGDQDYKANGGVLPHVKETLMDRTRSDHLLDMIAESSYWDRLWVQQELTLARVVIFAAGRAFLDCRLLQWREQQRAPTVQHSWKGKMSSAHDAMVGYRLVHPVPNLKSLAEVLGQNLSRRCNEPKDTIFGIMAMVLEHQRVVVDYTKTAEQLLEETLLVVLQSSDKQWEISSAENLITIFEKLGLKMRCDPVFDAKRVHTTTKRTRAHHSTDRYSLLPIEVAALDELDFSLFAYTGVDMAQLESIVLHAVQMHPHLLWLGWDLRDILNELRDMIMDMHRAPVNRNIPRQALSPPSNVALRSHFEHARETIGNLSVESWLQEFDRKRKLLKFFE